MKLCQIKVTQVTETPPTTWPCSRGHGSSISLLSFYVIMF